MKKSLEILKNKELLERELLGNILIINGEGIIAISSIVSSSDFSHYGTEFQVILNAKKDGGNHLHGISNSSKFISSVSFLRDLSQIAKELKELSTALNVFYLLEKSANEVPLKEVPQFVSTFQKTLMDFVDVSEEESSFAKDIIEDFRKQQQFYESKFRDGKGIVGISTGYKTLDVMIDGFRPGHLWVLGGYTNMGKTQAAINLVANMIKQGKRVVFYSLEMSKRDIMARLVGIMTDQNGTEILKMFPHSVSATTLAFDLIKKSNFEIHTEKVELSDILFSMMNDHARKTVDLFVIDFLQLVTVKSKKSEYEQTTSAILEFQNISKKMGCSMIVLSQISNEGAKNENESIISFKGSGAIAAAADLGIQLYFDNEDDQKKLKQMRKDMNEGRPVEMKWVIRKNRHGRLGSVRTMFNAKTGVFKELPN